MTSDGANLIRKIISLSFETLKKYTYKLTVLLEYIDLIFSEMTETVTEIAGRSLTAPSTMAGAISGTNHIHNTAN